MKTSRPKKSIIGYWLLSRMLNEKGHNSLIGDFEEIYSEIAGRDGRMHALLWYWAQIIKLLPSHSINAIYWRIVMFRNYLKMTLRNMRKHTIYSFINVIGLAIGMACCILILLWVLQELSFDRFHEKRDRLFRVLQHIKYSEVVTWSITQGPLGPALKEEIPEIDDFARYENARWRLRYNDNVLVRSGGYVDPSFLKMFSFPLIKGDPETALTDPHSMVITEELAGAIFGNEDPIGKVLPIGDRWDIKVTGVLKNSPDNSHLSFDFLGTMAFAKELGFSVERWTNSTFTTYLLLHEAVSSEIVEKKIYDFLDAKPTLEDWEKLTLQSIPGIHFSTGIGYDNAVKMNIQYIYIFFGAASFILLIACINFMNLSTARSSLRSKEVGIRKVAGAYKGQLIYQFLNESVLLSLFSFIIAMGIVALCLPYFNQLSGKNFSISSLGTPVMIMSIFVITVFTGVLSGSYPAFILSSFQVVKVLKGAEKIGTGKSLFRRTLVVFQFIISVLLLVGTFVIYSQIRYMQNQDIGYDKENLVFFSAARQVRGQYDAFRNELVKNPSILNVARSSSSPTFGFTFSNSLWHWEGQDPEEDVLFRNTFVDYDYFDTFNMEMVSGRPFSREFLSDSSGMILNEKALQVMGFDDPIGKRIDYGLDDNLTSFHVIGVVKDFNFRSLHSEIEPLVILLSGGKFGWGNPSMVYARIKSGNFSETIDFMKTTYGTFAPDYTFNYGFVDESFERLYLAEEGIGNILKTFTGLAIFISCLGLLGLASFMAMRRTKEIGVRKVFGASVSGIIVLLIKEFSKWIIIANIISWPLAYFAMNRWLQRFAYRTNVQLWIFLAVGGMTLMIAVFTVGYQAIKAARANPVDALRYE